MRPRFTYRPAPHLGVAVDRTTVRLFDTRDGSVVVLEPPASTAWELLAAGHDLPALVELLGLVAGLAPEVAEALFRETLALLCDRGLVLREPPLA